MENLSDTIGKFKELIAGFPQFSDEVAVTLSANAIQLVNSRIVDTGMDSKGKPLVHARSGKEYSDREIPTSVFVDSGMLTSAQAKSLPILSTYVDAKKLIGRYRGKRDLTLTGAMWKNTGLTSKQVTTGGFVATVAGKTTETQVKLNNNAALSDNEILSMSEEETAIISQDLDTELQLYIDRVLG